MRSFPTRGGRTHGCLQAEDRTASHRLTLPPGTRLDAEGRLVVYTSCGEAAPGRTFACVRGSAVWNNDGDTAFLRDPRGNLVDQREWVP